MKKIFQISIFVFYILLLYNCHSQCAGESITSKEQASVLYKEGDAVILRNDSSTAYDTLKVLYRTLVNSGQSHPCDKINSGISVCFDASSHLPRISIGLEHGGYQTIYLDFGIVYTFPPLNGTTQTMTINGKTYNDVYTVSIDSNSINKNIPINNIAWKIDYSKSQGFVRFHMLKGLTWSKL